MVDNQAVNEKIRKFILANFPIARKRGLSDTDRWLEIGILDSLGILDLVQFLEDEFAIRLSDDDLTPENFESLSVVSSFVCSRLGNSDQRQIACLPGH